LLANSLLVGFAPALERNFRHAPTPRTLKRRQPLRRRVPSDTVSHYDQRGTACHSHGDAKEKGDVTLRRRKWLTFRTLFFVNRVNGQSSQMVCITGRMRRKETLSVLPWTLHTRQA
jgi:hypothetical protein